VVVAPSLDRARQCSFLSQGGYCLPGKNLSETSVLLSGGPLAQLQGCQAVGRSLKWMSNWEYAQRRVGFVELDCLVKVLDSVLDASCAAAPLAAIDLGSGSAHMPQRGPT